MADKPQYGERTPDRETPDRPDMSTVFKTQQPWRAEPGTKLPNMMPPEKPKRERTPMNAASWVILSVFVAMLSPLAIWLWRWALGML